AGGPHYLRRLVRDPPPVPPSELSAAISLSGPTGEANTLSLVPRGRVACLADDDDAFAAQLRLIAMTRNIAIAARSAGRERIASQIGVRCEFVEDPLTAKPDVVLFAGSTERARELRQRLAQQDGPIVPIVQVDAEHPGEPLRLLSERSLSINTTASGGNASLLSLSEDA
ncbi:MAG TPA: hypothetical protein VGW79_08230, partial [Actinomycetota bacterium]|nr:hypothetical protein [Actinomycetota bacterium]